MTDNAILTASSVKKNVVEIDLNAIKHNLKLIKDRIGEDKKILLPVKADGYGHGAVPVAGLAEKESLVDILGVSSPEEGIELRDAGIGLPILILGLILPESDAINNILNYDLVQTVADTDLAQHISKRASELNKNAKLHLKIDTGMGRIGCRPNEAADIAWAIDKLENIELEGAFSHFPVADEADSSFTIKQIQDFEGIIKEIESRGVNLSLKHIANSAAILNYPDSVFNLVRPGISAYGYRASKNSEIDLELIPSMTFKSYIVFVKRMKKGTPLSYGLTYKTKSNANIATIPVGYGDGYNRLLSNKGKVIIGKKIYPVVGRVCMDQILVDLGNDSYPVGKEVILFGKEDITVDTIAEWIDTIPYEVTCAISKRVKRIYVDS